MIEDERVKQSSGEYRNAAVACENPQCSQIGMNILKKGGNSVDATISTLICIGMINSFSSGFGG